MKYQYSSRNRLAIRIIKSERNVLVRLVGYDLFFHTRKIMKNGKVYVKELKDYIDVEEIDTVRYETVDGQLESLELR